LRWSKLSALKRDQKTGSFFDGSFEAVLQANPMKTKQDVFGRFCFLKGLNAGGNHL
jgi:hypothetical protein